MTKTKQILNELGIKNYTIRDNGTVDVTGDVNIKDRGLTKLPVQFGVVTGEFDCSYNKLTSTTN